MTPRDPLLSYLCTRNLLMREANDPSVSDARCDDLTHRSAALEGLIVSTPAITLEGFAAKLMLTVEEALEGGGMSADQARALIREGRDAFGIGDFITPALEQEDAR